MLTIKEALDIILSTAKNYCTEEVNINEAYSRVLSKNILADRDYPPFNRSAMDGYAVISSDFNGREQVKLKVTQKVFAGETTDKIVVEGTCMKIMTGAPVPEGADAVVRVEDTLKSESGSESEEEVTFTITEVRKNQNIALQGEDAKQGDLTIAANTLLDANAIAVLAVTGQKTLEVYKTPHIAIVSTGNEVVEVGQPILPFQIRDSNSYSVKSFLKKYAISTIETFRFNDSKEHLQDGLKKLLSKDIVILSGGVSKGDADYVPEVLKSLGVRELFHRVKIKPGAPLWFGKLPNGGVVFGLPGNPVSVQVALKVFIEPFIRQCFSMAPLQPMLLPFLADKKKKTKFDEYFPCCLKTENGQTGIIPKKMNGSGDIAATLGSDGIALHPENVDLIDKGSMVDFYLW